MLNFKTVLPFLFLFFLLNNVYSQITDDILWASVKVQHQLNDKTSVAIAPIFRFNEGLSEYQNSSIDLSIKHKLGKGWYGQFITRTWFMPDRSDRQFLWFDIGYGRALNKMKLSSSLRFHLALDIKDIPDADFLRWKTVFTLPKMKKFQPFAAIEPWFRFNNFDKIQRVRYEIGTTFQVTDQIKLLGMYRLEDFYNIDPKITFNMYVATLIYTLEDFKKSK